MARRQKEVTHTLYGVTGRGPNVSAARADAARQLEAAGLGGDYTPRVYEWRGIVMLMFRHPLYGWEYRTIVDPQDGARNGPVSGNPLEGHDFKESERRVLRHLADTGWRREDGDTVPVFVTNEYDREELATRHRWQAFTIEAQDYGIADSEARCYYADVMTGGMHWLRGVTDEQKALVHDVLAGRFEGHRLHVSSLRDLAASCSCGGWELSAPAFDRDTDDELRERARAKFIEHLHAAVRAMARAA